MLKVESVDSVWHRAKVTPGCAKRGGGRSIRFDDAPAAITTMLETAATQSRLPTGAVTFVFTDIEGSTALWEQHPEAMQAALARHDTLLRDVIESSGGCVVKSTGDGVYAVFAAVADALAACVNAQRSL